MSLTMLGRSSLIVGLGLLVALACDSRSPRQDYDDFRARTAAEREAEICGSGESTGVLEDIRGRWLLRALLKGGIGVGLRIVFDAPDGPDGAPPTELNARIWLHDQPDDAPPLVETTTSISEDGRFELIADPLDLGTDVIDSQSAVVARVVMDSRINSPDEWCGDATGSVTSPLQLVLDGSTFYATRDTEGALVLDDLPFQCPGDPCAPDMGVTDMGVPDAAVDDGPERPESPDLSDVPSTRRDLTGDYFFNASLSGIAVRLWLSVFYRESVDAEGATVATIDGALRTATSGPGDPPATTFFAEVDAEGRFEVWLPEFRLDLAGLEIEADILLGAATVDGGWCGAAAGQARQPFSLPLDGSTFFAVPWATPGGEQPADVPNACPGMEPMAEE